jgi:hypothetical protein
VQNSARRQALQELRACRAIGSLTAGQQEGERATELVGGGVDLGRAAAARSGPPAGPEEKPSDNVIRTELSVTPSNSRSRPCCRSRTR